MGVDTGGISCCFDQESQKMFDDYRKKGLSDTAVAIAEAVSKGGLQGSTVLEIGCGFGALSMELVERGASAAVGLDLSPKMIRIAKALAAEKGLSGSISFRLEDGAAAKLPPSGIVILDTVLCCYPDMTALVENSSAVAEGYYAISIPDDRRFVTRAMKLFLPLQSLLFRRDRFRFFIHPSRRIVETLEAKGFKLVSRSPASWIWSVFVFRRF